jgi:hypothetical protein
MSEEWKKVYDLADDQETVSVIQRASLKTADFGFIPEIALFGSKEWWEAIKDGRIPRHEVKGVISRLYMSGHGDWPEFEIQSGRAYSQWTRLGDQGAYEIGKKIRLEFVLQLPKKRRLQGGGSIPHVIRISVQDCGDAH